MTLPAAAGAAISARCDSPARRRRRLWRHLNGIKKLVEKLGDLEIAELSTVSTKI